MDNKELVIESDEELVAIDPDKLRETLVEEKLPEQQRYKFMDCKTCKAETRFISTLSPKGFWICCRCRSKVSDKPFKVDLKSGDYRFSK